ncbi:flavodoxin family protein [Actinomyces trachealis]|uniref:flavodoxin family protein n=1 Tax=Actinomyces trachealis TaxID=2763540 RepID=UPI001892C00A|nr:flavodoxin family protein [Actinomyces trachealis]
MTTALIIVESCFGSTRAVAQSLAEELTSAGVSTRVLEVPDAPRALPEDLDLLVLAAPTHNRRLPSAASRAQAAKRGAPTSPSTGIREWLDAATIPPAVRLAAADTVTGRSWLSGSAAKDAAKRLHRVHGRADVACHSFLVSSFQGPLADGEQAAVRAWGHTPVQGLSGQDAR